MPADRAADASGNASNLDASGAASTAEAGREAPAQDGGSAMPPNPVRQALQLVVIPAVIVLVCIGLAVLFSLIAGGESSINADLMKLRQSSGSGQLTMGVQDPRYKDRGLAAYNIATRIPSIKDPAERASLSAELTDILDTSVNDREDILIAYLLVALGNLGQEDALGAIGARLDHPSENVRHAAVSGMLAWSAAEGSLGAGAEGLAAPIATSQERADQVRDLWLGALRDRLRDQSVLVRASSAAAVGALAPFGDDASITALRGAMDRAGREGREAQWNAAVALTRLGDSAGSEYVAELLLNRDALAEMPADESGGRSGLSMPVNTQDRILITTMAAVGTSEHPAVWRQIRLLAENDPNRAVQAAARSLVLDRDRDEDGQAGVE